VIDGHGWRSGAPVEKREIPMYYLRITDYADELLSYLDKMPGWPERVKAMQANWIGKSKGVRFAFTHDIRSADGTLIGDGRMYVFTTRADTIMGATFCAVAAEHPLATQAASTDPKVAAFVAECKLGSVKEADFATMEKKGMRTGLFVTHPLTREKIEVWVGNYVLMAYGDGAGDGRAGARRARLRVRAEIRAADQAGDPLARQAGAARADRPFSAARWEPMTPNTASACDAGSTTASLRRCGRRDCRRSLGDGPRREEDHVPAARLGHLAAAVLGHADPDRPLPCLRRRPGAGKGPPRRAAGGLRARRRRESAGEARGFRRPRPARNARGPAKREIDTMDTFVDSSWYYMRYASPDTPTMVDARNEYWNPMDQYIGGIEHAILHLLYARFWTKVMRDMGLVKFDEPFTRLMTQGMLLNHIFFRRTAKGGIDYCAPADVDVTHDADGRVTGARLKSDGQPVEYGGVGTMSKSKLNGVDPQGPDRQVRRRHRRLFVMFAGSPQDSALWSDAGVEGAHRFCAVCGFRAGTPGGHQAGA
jgi:leucyl-tRNA synthetase